MKRTLALLSLLAAVVTGIVFAAPPASPTVEQSPRWPNVADGFLQITSGVPSSTTSIPIASIANGFGLLSGGNTFAGTNTFSVLNVTSTGSFSGALTFGSALTDSSSFQVYGNSTFASLLATSLSDSGTLAVAGTSTLTGGVYSTAISSSGTMTISIAGNNHFEVYANTTSNLLIDAIAGSVSITPTLRALSAFTAAGPTTLSGTTTTSTLSVGASGTAIQQLIIATVSPSSGVATVTNAALTATTIPYFSILTQAGTTLQEPFPTMHAGSMSFTVTNGDTSTYSVLFLVK